MTDKTQKTIKKPWAVYHNLNFQYSIGKLVYYYPPHESSFWIKTREGREGEVESWQKEYVRAFDDPLKAIAYLLVITDIKLHRRHKSLIHRDDRKNAIQDFFLRFPSERANLEGLIPKQFAQTFPKNIEPSNEFLDISRWEDEGGAAQNQPRHRRKLKKLERLEDCGFPDGYDSV